MTSSPEIDRLFQEGVAAIRSGDKAAGREKLLQVVEMDEMHEQGWLWLSATVEANDDRIVCLENVLTINPDNEHAQRGLEKLTGRKTPAPPPTASAPAESAPSPPSTVSAPAGSPPPAPAPPPPVPTAPPPSMPTARIPDPPVPTAPQPATSDWTEDSGEAEIESLLDAIEARIQEKSSLSRSLFEENKPAQRSSPPSDESWQQPRAEATPPLSGARSGGASSAWAKDADAEPAADRSLLDLFDAWFAAMLFNAEGSFALELPVAAWDRVLVNLVFTGIIAAMGGILQALLISTLGGGSLESFVVEQYPELFDLLGEASVNMSQLMGAAGIIYLVVTVVSTVLTGLFVGVGVHAASRVLGGSGEMIETLHSLTMARVAFQIVNLLPMIVIAVVPGLSDILNLAAFGYALAVNVFAISYVHREFGIWKSILTLLLGGFIAVIVLSVVFCCFIFALAAALGGAAS